jgi:hypothetical protein
VELQQVLEAAAQRLEELQAAEAALARQMALEPPELETRAQ